MSTQSTATPDDKLANISVTFPEDLLEQIETRIKALDLNRSQYLRALARRDLETVPKKSEVAA